MSQLWERERWKVRGTSGTISNPKKFPCYSVMLSGNIFWLRLMLAKFISQWKSVNATNNCWTPVFMCWTLFLPKISMTVASVTDLPLGVRQGTKHWDVCIILTVAFGCVYCSSHFIDELANVVNNWFPMYLAEFARGFIKRTKTLDISDSETLLFSLVYSVCQNFIYFTFSGFWKEKYS